MEPRIIHVEVDGQRYPVRTSLDPKYVQDLAAYVDRKMRLASESSPSSDTVGMAVLTALNIADELFRARTEQSVTDGTFQQRAEALERIVDEALMLAGD
ncbi:MAG: cell division protein ZapA [Acidobacteria bacterium]|nr:cell division protein ZapA [Acidobacteriota bacterium]